MKEVKDRNIRVGLVWMNKLKYLKNVQTSKEHWVQEVVRVSRYVITPWTQRSKVSRESIYQLMSLALVKSDSWVWGTNLFFVFLTRHSATEIICSTNTCNFKMHHECFVKISFNRYLVLNAVCECHSLRSSTSVTTVNIFFSYLFFGIDSLEVSFLKSSLYREF